MLTQEQRTERARKAGKASLSPDGMAMRLARRWDTIDPAERARIIALLRPLIGPEPRRRTVGDLYKDDDR